MVATTIITCLYKLRNDINDQYLQSIKRLLIVKNPMVIYTDEFGIEFLNNTRNNYGYKDITKVILIPFKETYFYKYKDTIINNRKKYWPTADSRCDENVHMLMLGRFNFCINAIENNYFNTNYFSFIDINLLNKKPWGSNNYTSNDVYHKLYYILNNPKKKCSVNIINVFNKDMYKDLHNFYQTYRYTIAGCFLTFDKINGLEMYKKAIQYAKFVTISGYGHGDEHILGKIYIDNPNLFNLNFGDYQDIIDNYYEINSNINYSNKVKELFLVQNPDSIIS